MDLESLRSMVSDKDQRMKQTHIVLLCLNFVEENPENVSTVGCCWDSDNTFMINSTIFGNFIGRDPNTINRNFRTHGFSRIKSSSKMREKVPIKFGFNNIPDPQKWFQRQCPNFTKNTKVDEACAMKYHKLIPKKHIKKISDIEPSNNNLQINIPNEKSLQIDKSSSIIEIKNNMIDPLNESFYPFDQFDENEPFNQYEQDEFFNDDYFIGMF